MQPVTELPRMGKDVIAAAVRKAFDRYRPAIADVYSLKGPVARAVTQVHDEATLPEPEEPSEPADTLDMDEAIQREMDADPFELELEIERELLSEQGSYRAGAGHVGSTTLTGPRSSICSRFGVPQACI